LTSTATIQINAALLISESDLILAKNAQYLFDPQGGVPPYSFSLISGKGTIDALTGNYTAPAFAGSAAIQITDSVANTVVKVVTISDGMVINPNSATLAKGAQLTFSAYGGVGPYTYTLKSGSIGTMNSSSGLFVAPSIEGSAIAIVTDSKGQKVESQITITNDLTFNVGNIILSVGNSIDLISLIEGGTPPFNFTVGSHDGSMSASVYTAPTIPGIYNVGLADSGLHPHQATLKVIVNSELVLLPMNFQVTVDGTKKLTPLGGVAPYTYSVLSGGGSVSATGTYTAPNQSGNAVIQIKDARNNTALSNVLIGESLVISPLTKNVLNGESISFSATGGIPPYTYSVVGGVGSINPATGAYVSPNLAAIETVRVEDSAGNRSDSTVTVIPRLSLGSSVYLLKNGTKTFSAISGKAPYTYSLVSGVGSINAATGLYTAPNTTGDAVVRVTDANSATHEVSVKVYDFLTISPMLSTIAKNQTLTFSANWGVPPYYYTLRSGVGSLTTSGRYISAVAGDAVVRVTDAINNTMDANITVNTSLTIAPSQLTTLTNKKSTFTISGGVSPYVFSVKSGQGTIDSSTGEYTAPAMTGSAVVKVTDSTNTTDEATITINESLNLAPENPVISSGDSVSFSVSGGTPPYLYSKVSGVGTLTGATYTSPAVNSGGTATIKVTDSIGNTFTTLVTYSAVKVTISSPTMFDYANSANSHQFPVTGTCTELSRPVVLKMTGGLTVRPTCLFGSFTTNVDLSGLNDGPLSITADHNSALGIEAQSSIVMFNKDVVLPTVSIDLPISLSSFINEVQVMGSCTKVGLVNITGASGVSGTGNCDGNIYSANVDISTAAQGNLVLTVSHVDGRGNTTETPPKVTITHDSVPPVVSQFVVTNSRYTSSSTYFLNFTETGISTQYCILENSTQVESCTWNNLPLPTIYEVTSLNNDKVLSAWVKDLAGNISTRVDANTVTLNTTIPEKPSINIFNPITTPNKDTAPVFSVTSSNILNGDTVKIYLDPSCTGVVKGLSSTVVSSGLINVQSSNLAEGGPYQFYAQTTNNAGTKSVCSDAAFDYYVDLTAPTVASVTGSGNGPSTPLYLKADESMTVSIQFSESVYVTGTPVLALATGRIGAQATYESGSGTNTLNFKYTVVNLDNSSDLSYAEASSLTLNGGTIKDYAGNSATLTLPNVGFAGSLSANQQIVVDTTLPVAPSSIVDGIWLNSLSASPAITFVAGTDVSGSGVAKQKIQVIRSSDSVVMQSWVDLTAVATNYTFTNITTALSDAVLYKVQIKSIDNAGNESLVATSDGWTADVTVPVAPLTLSFGSVPNSLTTSPTLTWATNGTDTTSGVSSYNVNVYSGSTNIKSVVGFTKGASISGLSLTNATSYSAKVMSVDSSGNIGPESLAASWTTAATTVISLSSGSGSNINVVGNSTAMAYSSWVNFVYTNTGGAPSGNLSAALANTTSFELWTNTTTDPNNSAYTGCNGISLGAGASCSVFARSKATDNGTLTASTLNLTCTSGCPAGVALSGTSSGFVFSVSINGTANLSITNAWLTGQGWNGSHNVSITANSGDYYSNSTATAALIINVTMPAGRTLTFINNGRIIGCGGAGGAPGSPGGVGLRVLTATTIINNNIIAGGGGGGGAEYFNCAKGGYGAGHPSYSLTTGQVGNASSYQNIGTPGTWGSSGNNSYGSPFGAGSGSANGPTNLYVAGAGGGGAWGSSGGYGGYYPALPQWGAYAGGAGGAAVSGTAYITWSVTGSRYGAVQ
jgi:hypothetical protein